MEQTENQTQSTKISLENVEYNNFVNEFEKGTKYLGLRFGQAFHEHFQLDKVKNSITKGRLRKIYNLDGKKAKTAIAEVFEIA